MNTASLKSVFIFGLGYVGLDLAKSFNKMGWKIYGTKRNLDNFDNSSLPNLTLLEFNNGKKINNLSKILKNCSHLISTIGPIDGYDPILKTHSNEIKNFSGWIGYLSSTSVYSGSNKTWIDEKTIPLPISQKGKIRIEVENEWLRISNAEIFRISGIYGPGRNFIKKLQQGNFKVIDKKNHLFNRIHQTDISKIILAVIKTPKKNRIINFTDGNPASKLEVAKFTAKLLGSKPPIPIKYSEKNLSKSIKEYYSSSKKIRSIIIKELGIKLNYPTYKDGIRGIIGQK